MLLVPFLLLSVKSPLVAAVCYSLHAISMCVVSTGLNHHLMPWRSWLNPGPACAAVGCTCEGRCGVPLTALHWAPSH